MPPAATTTAPAERIATTRNGKGCTMAVDSAAEVVTGGLAGVLLGRLVEVLGKFVEARFGSLAQRVGELGEEMKGLRARHEEQSGELDECREDRAVLRADLAGLEVRVEMMRGMIQLPPGSRVVRESPAEEAGPG